jgi:hypothetical protein
MIITMRVFQAGRSSKRPAVLLPLPDRRERQRHEAGCFRSVNAVQPQAGPGELVDCAFVEAAWMPLMLPQQPEQSAGRGAKRDLRVSDPGSY